MAAVAEAVIRLEAPARRLAIRRPRRVERLAHIFHRGPTAAATSRAIRSQAGGRRRDGSGAGHASHARTSQIRAVSDRSARSRPARMPQDAIFLTAVNR